MEEEKIEKKREYQFDLLKIVGMLMIIFLHCLTHGVQFPQLEHSNLSSYNYIILMIFKCICIVAVNCYFLITGYYCINKKWNSKKILNLWAVVLFYAVTFFVIFGTKYHLENSFILQLLLPILSGEYWFFTAYILLYILSPVINMILRKLTKSQFQLLLILAIGIFMGMGVIYPLNRLFDEYLVLDAMIIYMVGAYLKLHYTNTKKKSYYFSRYGIIAITSAFLAIIFNQLYTNTGNKIFDLYYEEVFSYGSIIVAISSVYLFLGFEQIKIKNKWIQKAILFFQPLTFAVYLIHDNIFVRRIWSKCPMFLEGNTPFYIFRIIFFAICVFLLCSMIEYGRKKVFTLIGKRKIFQLINQEIQNNCQKIEKKVNNVIQEGGEKE